jgi:hypothetical protein
MCSTQHVYSLSETAGECSPNGLGCRSGWLLRHPLLDRTEEVEHVTTQRGSSLPGQLTESRISAEYLDFLPGSG